MEVFEDNRALLDAFRAGRAAALEEVYNAYVDRVFDLVRLGFMLNDGKRVTGIAEPHNQRDLIHDIFVRAFAEKARLAFDGLRPYQPYLLRIAKNLMIDRHRKRGEQVTSDGDVSEHIAGSDDGPRDDSIAVESVHWKALIAVTRQWRASLDDETRRYVELRFEGDLGQRDVASRMGVSRRRVRTLEAGVHKGLLGYLKKKGFI